MVKIKIRLKSNSNKNFLTTLNGQTITKEYNVFDDDDLEIEKIIYNREDLDIVEFKEKFIDNETCNEVFRE